MAGATLGGGAEAGTVDSESNRGLDSGPGQLRSSDEAGRAHGAGGDTEEGNRRHGERWVVRWEGVEEVGIDWT